MNFSALVNYREYDFGRSLGFEGGVWVKLVARSRPAFPMAHATLNPEQDL